MSYHTSIEPEARSSFVCTIHGTESTNSCDRLWSAPSDTHQLAHSSSSPPNRSYHRMQLSNSHHEPSVGHPNRFGSGQQLGLHQILKRGTDRSRILLLLFTHSWIRFYPDQINSC